MRTRKQEGGTMALVVASTIIIVLLGIAFFFIMQIIGGGRELQHAVDAGALNLAKQTAAYPAVDYMNGTTPFDQATDFTLQGVEDSKAGGHKVNLRSFNRMIGQALLVGLNASAAGGNAIANAQSYLNRVEGKNNSIGLLLKNALIDPESDNGNPGWAAAAFNAVGLSNSIRMLGDSSQITWQKNDFLPLFVRDFPGSNIDLGSILANLPYDIATQTSVSIPGSAITPGPNGSQLLAGYTEFQIANVGGNYAAVPLEANPHLISMNQVVNTDQPGKNNVALPPNAFRVGATAIEQRNANSNVHLMSVAIVGTSLPNYPVTMPYGFIRIDNNAGGRATTPQTLHVPNTQNVFAHELGSGIMVDRTTQYFSTTNVLNDWQNWNPKDPNGQPVNRVDAAKGLISNFSPPAPSVQGLFDASGNPATAEGAASIPLGGDTIVCTDTNSDPGGGNTEPICEAMARPNPNNPNGLDIFDLAYWPNGGLAYGQGGGASNFSTVNLTAAEQTCAMTLSLWQQATEGTISVPVALNVPQAIITGIRKYPDNPSPIKGQQTPWAKAGLGFNQAGFNSYSQDHTCQVTTNGTIWEISEQTQAGAGDKVVRLIKQRMDEILQNGSQQYDNVVKNTRIPLGATNGIFYIYLRPDQVGRPTNTFTMSTTPPAWLGSSKNNLLINARADGIPYDGITVTYGVAQTLGDAHNQAAIHDHPFLTINGSNQGGSGAVDPALNDTVQATDTVQLVPGSGANLDLLDINLIEILVGGSSLPSTPPELTDRD